MYDIDLIRIVFQLWQEWVSGENWRVKYSYQEVSSSRVEWMPSVLNLSYDFTSANFDNKMMNIWRDVLVIQSLWSKYCLLLAILLHTIQTLMSQAGLLLAIPDTSVLLLLFPSANSYSLVLLCRWFTNTGSPSGNEASLDLAAAKWGLSLWYFYRPEIRSIKFCLLIYDSLNGI